MKSALKSWVLLWFPTPKVSASIITDGDIRRAVQKHDEFHSLTAADFMSTNFKTIAADDMVNDALELMDLYKEQRWRLLIKQKQ